MFRAIRKEGILLGFLLLVSVTLLATCRDSEEEPTPTSTATVAPVEATETPPAEVPATEVPPTEVISTEVPPTEVPPTEVPPTEEPPTEILYPVGPPDPFECLNFTDAISTSVDIEKVREFDKEFLPFVPGQIILTGSIEDIQRVVSNPDISETYGLITATNPIPLPSLDESVEFETNLYTISSGADVITAIQSIYEVMFELQQGQEDPLFVFPQPNRLTGAPLGIDADPLGIDADPLGIDADADSAPEEAGSSRLPGEIVKGPWNQWALTGTNSISLYETSAFGSPRRHPSLEGVDGNGIDVFIFDTSPFTRTDVVPIMGRDLCVYHPTLVNEITVAEDISPAIKEHGYFVAGLVRMVAPNSHLHLVRVLNEQAVGDIFSFIVVLNDLMLQRGPNMNNSVLNLSLSLRDFEEDAVADQLLPTGDILEALLASLPDEYHPYITTNDVFPALDLIMRQAYDDGAVIVAASGNDSDLTLTPNPEDLETGIPAVITTTVGVAGSDIHGGRACFSNQPEVNDGLLAPSGDGIWKEAPGATEELRDRESKCEFPFPWQPEKEKCPPSLDGRNDCKYTLTSAVTKDTSEARFAHWLGTSFATPLVSGTAALMLEADEDDDCDNFEITDWLRNYPEVLQVPDAVNAAVAGCPPPPTPTP